MRTADQFAFTISHPPTLCRDRNITVMNIYVGNLSWGTTDDDLRNAFEAYGGVTSATVMRDKATGRSRGFGFVEMPARNEAMAAIEALNGKEMDGRALTVNEARPKEERRGGGGGDFRRGEGSRAPRRDRDRREPRW